MDEFDEIDYNPIPELVIICPEKTFEETTTEGGLTEYGF